MATMPDLPDDVQILTKSYPMELPVEAGEKQITLEERLAVPDMDLTARVISYDLIPAITEQKVVGNRLVFRGNAKLSVMYMTEDAEIKKWETEIPFSQYKDLDKEYEATASAWVMPVVTALELEEDENGELILRAGISAQYLVYERILIDVVQDAYSPLRQMEIEYEDLMPPALLDQFTCEMSSETDIDADETQILSCAHFQDYPTLGNDVTMDGRFHLLYRNNEGQMSSGTTYCQWHGNIFYDEGNQVCLWPGIPSEPAVSPGVDYVHIESRYPVWVQMYSGHKIPMVTELKLGECKEPDDHRPSIVLRRAGEEGLWQLAKEYGSTVELIKEANQITQEPIVGQMLLIPVM